MEINNFVNEDDIPNQKYCHNSNNKSKIGSKVMETDRKELFRSLLILLNTELSKVSGNPKNEINNRLLSRTETMNLLNTLKSTEIQKKLEAERYEDWKTPLIEDFLPSNESEETTLDSTSVDNHNRNNSELNYYGKRLIENLL